MYSTRSRFRENVHVVHVEVDTVYTRSISAEDNTVGYVHTADVIHRLLGKYLLLALLSRP